MAKQKEDRIGYGVKLPPLSFEDAIRIIKEVSKIGGFEGTADALSQVTGNTASSSTFIYKVYTLKGFGLLRFQARQYELTEIGKRVAQPESSEDEANAIFEAFQNNEMLKKAWENYNTKILPHKDYLANFFEKNLGIPAQLKLDWADYFTEAAKFAKLLHERESGTYQVLSKPSRVDRIEFKDTVAISDQLSITQSKSLGKPTSLLAQVEAEHFGILNKRRVSGERLAIFAIPDELSQEDIDMLRVILKGIDASLDGLKKQEEFK